MNKSDYLWGRAWDRVDRIGAKVRFLYVLYVVGLTLKPYVVIKQLNQDENKSVLKNKPSLKAFILLGGNWFRIKIKIFLYSCSCQLTYTGYIQYKGQNLWCYSRKARFVV